MSTPRSSIALSGRAPWRGGVGAAALLACLLAAGTSALAGAWITDAHSSCQVWDPNPQIDETAAWSGACAGGRAQGPGIVQWTKGNLIIETDKGEWRDGRQVGKGVQTWSTGSYEGELSNGEPNGQGVLTMPKLRYEGQFRDGKPNGSGSLTEGATIVRGIWKDGCLQDGQRKASIGIPLSACR